MKEAVMKVIDTLTQEDFYGAFQKLLEWYKQVHCSQRRLLQRGQEFHVCTINKKYEKSLETYLMILIYKEGCCRSIERIRIYFKIRRSMRRFVFFEFIYFVLTYVLYICLFLACCFHQRTYVAQGLVNTVLNETWTHSGFQYKWP